ncbi:MAG: leucine--tRNA ligase [Candidatus Nanoarchaeia archaeon]
MDITTIHEKWQRKWDEAGLGKADPVEGKKKFFAIFAYPGISGFLHFGHMRGYTYTDTLSRYKRMTGHNVLFPVGTHASGNMQYAFVKKVLNKDEKWLEYLKRNGATDEDIASMNDVDGVTEFFNKSYINDSWKKFGFLCDWRRFTCTSYPDYNKFIEWQFKKLSQKNLLVQKPYYATFCPEDGPIAVDPSETDISKGGNAEKQEYTLLKFKLGDDYLIAATLRPETVFGQTNLWIHPDAPLVKADVNGETWIMSGSAAEKLQYQKDNVMVVGEVNPKDLLGKTVEAPMIKREVPILPASFCDPDVGSGLVTCVPSDAPYDYVALRDLQKDPRGLEQYGLDPTLANIELIPIIKSKGYGDFPGKEAVEKAGIKSQEDKEKLDKITKEIYKAGFHSGIMCENAGEFAGKRVTEAKELIKSYMLESKEADVFHDLSEEVICRCGSKVIIKRVDDQWFIKYSDAELTEKSKEHAKDMRIYPKDFHQNLPNILDWFSDRACTRLGKWVGTKLPFDEKWVVEPIADSTLYPIYYLVSPYVNDGRLSPDEMDEAFFDYVFLGEGEAKRELWGEIRRDVEYWYPLDVNTGGVDHRTVHFPVFIMNHVGILPAKMWPRGILVNAWITGKAGKISKSKGGATPIPGLVDQYGVDTCRMYYCHVGSPDSAVEWDDDQLIHYKHLMERIYSSSEELLNLAGTDNGAIDEWLESRLHECIKQATTAMEAFDLRDAATTIYFTMPEIIKWYQRRGGNNKGAAKQFVQTWARLLMPITPHLAEELWSLSGGTGLVSAANWPIVDEDKIHPKFSAGESLIQNTIEDVRHVLKLAKIDEPKEVLVFVTPQWKSSVYEDIKKAMGSTRNMGEILREVLNDERKEYGKDISKIVGMVIKNPSKMPVFILDHDEEYKLLNDGKAFISKEFGAEVKLVKAEESTETKAGQAMPGKPAILVK